MLSILFLFFPKLCVRKSFIVVVVVIMSIHFYGVQFVLRSLLDFHVYEKCYENQE